MQTVLHLGDRHAMDEDLSFFVAKQGVGYYAIARSMQTDWKAGPFATADQAAARCREYAKKAFNVTV